VKTGTPEQYRWLKGILVAILSLNVIDAAVTLFWVSTGRASEANPLMAPLLDVNAVVFVLVKLGLVMLGVLLLWRLRRRPLAVVGIILVFVVYYLALLLHAAIFSRVYLVG
jgi:hypothetical protein